MLKSQRTGLFAKQNSGTVAVEFALVAPLLVFLLLSTFELTRFTLLHIKLQRVTSTIASAVSQQTLTRSALIGIMGASDQITNPFNFQSNGDIVVSQVRNHSQTSDPANMFISWQQSLRGAPSKLGTPGDFPQNMPNGVDVIKTQALIIVETYYEFIPVGAVQVVPAQSIYKISLTPPRMGTMDNLSGEAMIE